MFRESIFSLLNRVFIKNKDFIQSLIIIKMTADNVYN